MSEYDKVLGNRFASKDTIKIKELDDKDVDCS